MLPAVVEIQTGGEGEERMFCGFVHDLSRQKRDADIMKGTIDTSLDPVLHINENGIIQMVNNAACSHLGWTREELVGENVSLIVGGEHAKQHGKYIERYLETGEKRAMGKKRALTARRKDGRYAVSCFLLILFGYWRILRPLRFHHFGFTETYLLLLWQRNANRTWPIGD